MSADYAEVLQTNEDFFYSIQERDLEIMKSLWDCSDDSLCCTGEGNVVTGYDSIMAMWNTQLSKTSPTPPFILDNINMAFQGDVAIITQEKHDVAVTRSRGNRAMKSKGKKRSFYVTNVFVKPSNLDRYLLYVSISTPFSGSETNFMKKSRELYRDPLAPSSARGNNVGKILELDQLSRLIGRGKIIGRGGFGIGGDDGGEEEEEEDDGDEVEDDTENEESIIAVGGDDFDEDIDDDEKKEGDKKNLAQLQEVLQSAFGRMVGSGSLPGNGKLIIIRNGEEMSMSDVPTTRIVNDLETKKKNLRAAMDKNFENSNNGGFEDEQYEMKELAFRTISALQWLYDRGRISAYEKRTVTMDIISNLSTGDYSRAEVAYSLLIGSCRPGERELSKIPLDLDKVDQDDLKDFESVIHRYKQMNT